jgi:hypothetical protein
MIISNIEKSPIPHMIGCTLSVFLVARHRITYDENPYAIPELIL